MADTSGRLLELLGLLQVPRSWTGTELAERLEVTTRTVRNDVERLRMLGYRVDGFRGSAGGYRLAPGSKLPPLLLDDADVIAITASLLTASTGSVAGMEETAQRALAKLEQVMPPPCDAAPTRCGTAVVQVPTDTAPPTVDPEVLAVISAACRDHEVLRFDYRTHDSERTQRRVVEPHRLVNWGRRWYLFAYDPAKQDWRTYRVDRMVPNPPAGPRFRPRRPPVDDVAAYVSRGTVGCRVAPPRDSDRVRRRRQRLPKRFRLRPASSSRSMRPRAPSPPAPTDLTTLATHLGLLDVDFRVDGPPDLVAKLRQLADRYGSARSVRIRPDAEAPSPASTRRAQEQSPSAQVEPHEHARKAVQHRVGVGCFCEPDLLEEPAYRRRPS